MDWSMVGSIAASVTALTVAVAGLVKNRSEARLGVRSAVRDDQAALDARYERILSEVRESLVEPLRGEVARLRDEVAQLREDLERERVDLREKRMQYRCSLSHIRRVRHLAEAEGVELPEVPPQILQDLHTM